MEATVKRAIERAILTEFPSTDLEYDIDWEIMEISFKVGYEQSVLDNDNWARDTYGYEQGIRKVVEFVDNFAGIKHNPEWQAQKKVWLNDRSTKKKMA